MDNVCMRVCLCRSVYMHLNECAQLKKLENECVCVWIRMMYVHRPLCVCVCVCVCVVENSLKVSVYVLDVCVFVCST